MIKSRGGLELDVNMTANTSSCVLLQHSLHISSLLNQLSKSRDLFGFGIASTCYLVDFKDILWCSEKVLQHLITR